jgi:hypothetical protein
VTERSTVRQVRRLFEALAPEREPVRRATFYDRFCDTWRIELTADVEQDFEAAGHFRDEANHLYLHDARFRDLADQWLVPTTGTWRLLFASAIDGRHRPQTSYEIDWSQQRLTLYSAPLFYQSAFGPRLMESRRRLVGALFGLVVGQQRDADALDERYDRGLVVYLEDRYLRQATGFPARVSAQLGRSARALARFSVKARRIAEAEDAAI